MPIEVTAVAEDDWSALKAIRLQALAEAPTAFGSTLEREQAFPDEIWQHRAAAGSSLLARLGDQVVGTAAGVADPAGGHGSVQLVGMYVDPLARGTGCAFALIDGVAALASAAGASRLRLYVTEVNPSAERCYRRYGFRATGRSMPLPHAPHIAELEMVLELGVAPRSNARPSTTCGAAGVDCPESKLG